MIERTPVGLERPTIYDFVGGMSTLERLTDSFYEKVRCDDVLAPVFVDFTPAHAHHVAVWLAEVFGGPAAYSDRHGGHRGVLTAHLGRGITEEQRVRWVELILESARDVFPADDLLHRQFADYIEWGTGIAREVSQPGVDVGEPGPPPRWGWAGLIS